MIGVICAVGALRLQFLDVPLERDEGEYAYGGQLLLQGVPPFAALYNMKLPGAQIAYALAMAVFGQSIAGIRLGLILATAATSLLVFLLGRRLVGGVGGVAAGATHAFLAVQPAMLGPFGHATHFVALAGTAGLVVLFRGLDRPGLRAFYASGILLGLAVMMKQPGVVFLLFAAAAVVSMGHAGPRGAPVGTVRRLAVLLAGFLTPLLALGVWLAAAGVFDTFWLWVVRYGGAYAGRLSPAEGWELLKQVSIRIAAGAPWLWGLAGAGLVLGAVPRRGLRRGRILIAFLGFSFAGACPGFYFREHYFLIVLPAAALLAGGAVEFMVRSAGGRGVRPRAAGAGLLVAVVLAGADSIAAQRQLFFSASPTAISRAIYGFNPFPESVEVARYLREHTRDRDRIAVLGSEPQIPFYARRRSASGFVYMYPLMEPHGLARGFQEAFIREVESAEPAYIVWIGAPTSWLRNERSESLVFDWATRYLTEGYQVVGRVRSDETGIRYLWDEEAASDAGGGADGVIVLRRK